MESAFRMEGDVIIKVEREGEAAVDVEVEVKVEGGVEGKGKVERDVAVHS